MMKKREDRERKEKAIRYIDSQIAKLNDGYLIEYLIKTKKEIQKDLEKTPQKKYRESLAVNVSRNPRNTQRTSRSISAQQRNASKSKKPKIKDKPKKSYKKAAFYGIIAGVILGVPAGNIAYNYVKEMPSAHNYITVEEAKKGITDRKDHDNSKYKKYLMEKYDLTAEQADERIKREEEEGKWSR